MTTRSRWWARSALLSLATFSGLSAGSSAAEGEEKATAARVKGTVTFNKDIAPLVFQHCSSCHRPGEVAPFPLLSYRDVSKRVELVRTVIEERTMPPWKAEPGFGHFADERRLTDDQFKTIARWIDDGTPEGDAADLPPAPKFVTGWKLGEPDLVVKMDEPYALEAEGPDVYRCFVIPLEVPAGKYLKAVEYRPGNRRIVHHAVLSTLPERVAKARLAEGDGKSFGSGLAPPGQLLPGQLAFWTPGMEPRPLPDGFAAEFPDQSKLVMQLHLHPSGKSETEQSSIGFHFTDQKPRGRLRLVMLSNNKIEIPAGDERFVVNASRTIPGPVDLYGVFPHMHLIGRSVKVTATLPDGTTKPVISIPDWNFNWQNYYQYASPVSLPAGTRLEGTWTYDNSSNNPANPSHPPKGVSYGEQTTNEMAIAILDVIPTGPATTQATPPPPSPEEIARRAANAMSMMDKDKDGKLSLDEIVTILGPFETRAEMEKRVAQFDRDGDDMLNPDELAETLKAMRRRPNSPER
jgi:mono/diheme cytochrome c family protein